jgi:hypothetical protein
MKPNWKKLILATSGESIVIDLNKVIYASEKKSSKNCGIYTNLILGNPSKENMVLVVKGTFEETFANGELKDLF